MAGLSAFGFKVQLFSNDDVQDLNQLWQLRHSIVHTAGTLTRPDAQKVQSLNEFGGRNIVFSNKFIYELVRRLHSLVFQSVDRYKAAFISNLSSVLTTNENQNVLEFFKIESPKNSWLK